MDANDAETIAQAILRSQTMAEEKRAADAAETARVAAEAAAKAATEQAARDEAERPAREAAAQKAARRDASINAVLAAGWGERFVDPEGTIHRKAGPAPGHTFETAGSTKEGQTVIGRWGKDRDNSPLGTWRKV